MKKYWKLMMIAAMLVLAVLIPASAALGAFKLPKSEAVIPATGGGPIKVIASGVTTGTWEIDMYQNASGNLSPATSTNIDARSTMGSYRAPSGKTYINTASGQSGLVVLQSGQQIGFEQATVTANPYTINTILCGLPGNCWTVPLNVVPLFPVPVRAKFCATDLMSAVHGDGTPNDPNTGVLAIGDEATGLEFFYNMSFHSWASVLSGAGTISDMSFRESWDNDEAWATGRSNSVYHFTNAGGAENGGQPALDSAGTRFNTAVLGQQSRTFTLDGTEYVVWSDGAAGDLVFIKTSDNSDAGRFHVVNGENHSIGLNIPGGGNSATGDLLGVLPDFQDGSMTGVRIYHDSNYNLQVDVRNTVAGTGTSADICGLDVVESGGQWVRN